MNNEHKQTLQSQASQKLEDQTQLKAHIVHMSHSHFVEEVGMTGIPQVAAAAVAVEVGKFHTVDFYRQL